MANFCPKCGSSLSEGAKFCASCGSQFQAEPHVAPEPMPAAPPPTQPVQPMPPPPPGPPQAAGQPPMSGYAAPPPKKSSGKIIGAVVAVIVIVVVIVIAFFLLTGGLPGTGGGASQVAGTWEFSLYGTTFGIRLDADGSFYADESGTGSYERIGTWSINDDQLCFEGTSLGISSGECYSYQLSNGGNTLSFTVSGIPLTFTRV